MKAPGSKNGCVKMYGKSRKKRAFKGTYGPVRGMLCFVCGEMVTLKVHTFEGPIFYCERESIFLSDSGAFLQPGDRANREVNPWGNQTQ